MNQPVQDLPQDRRARRVTKKTNLVGRRHDRVYLPDVVEVANDLPDLVDLLSEGLPRAALAAPPADHHDLVSGVLDASLDEGLDQSPLFLVVASQTDPGLFCRSVARPDSAGHELPINIYHDLMLHEPHHLERLHCCSPVFWAFALLRCVRWIPYFGGNVKRKNNMLYYSHRKMLCQKKQKQRVKSMARTS